MIPPDVASSLRQILPDAQAATNAASQPVAQAQRIADVLSNLVPGQRVLAEIQALLPNGNYRAIVAQRDVTLALPFSAKAGDSIELEVQESDGKLTLAFVANRSEGTASKTGQESVSTTLSSAGKLIGNLMTGIDDEGKRAPATPLNGNQALVETMPKNAAELAPVLKQALTQSGMFYEAHQAKWVAGQLPVEALRQEPQAKFSPLPQTVTVNGVFEAKTATTANTTTAGNPSLAANIRSDVENPAAQLNATPLASSAVVQQKLNLAYSTLGSDSAEQPGADLSTLMAKNPEQALSNAGNGTIKVENAASTQITQTVSGAESGNTTSTKPEAATLPATGSRSSEQTGNNLQAGNPVPRELTPIVQQQLDGLANQNFAWQGQVWPGQQMWWEIGENPANAGGQDVEIAQWQTRLKLSLPTLGGIDAVLQLRPNGEVGIAINTDTEASEIQLKESAKQLRSQFESAGLSLSKLFIQHAQPGE